MNFQPLRDFVDWMTQTYLTTVDTFHTQPGLAVILVAISSGAIYCFFALLAWRSEEKTERFLLFVVVVLTLLVGSVLIGAWAPTFRKP